MGIIPKFSGHAPSSRTVDDTISNAFSTSMSTRAALCFFLNASALVMCDTTVAMASHIYRVCIPFNAI